MNGAMYSPGFFPGSYFGKPGNSGYDFLRALGLRHSFDPATTPWREMSAVARRAFLFGEEAPLEVEFRTAARTTVRTVSWRGLFSLVEHWDIGGLYTADPARDAAARKTTPGRSPRGAGAAVE
jgi:excinuclease ABC subunit A